MITQTPTPVVERPILYSGPMVRAVLAKRKTQTRRVIKPQPCNPSGASPIWGQGVRCQDPTVFSIHAATVVDGERVDKWIRCPYGKPGDRLWVRETFCDTGDETFRYGYKATTDRDGDRCRLEMGLKWTPSIHMPRAASRILLEVTAVRVERVQSISEADAIAEGCPPEYLLGINWYRNLWDSINSKREGCAWYDNPWVWVIEFKVLEFGLSPVEESKRRIAVRDSYLQEFATRNEVKNAVTS